MDRTPSSDAARMRRVRAHKKGDHGLCTAKTCHEVIDGAARVGFLPAAPVSPAGPDGEWAPGQIAAKVTLFVEALPYGESDPRTLIGQIAVELARRIDDQGAVPAAVRELRMILVWLAEAPNGAPGPTDEVRLQRAQRKLDQMLAAM